VFVEQNMEKEKAAEPLRRSSRKLRSGKESLTVYITPEVIDRLRVKCALDRLKLSTAVQMALDDWLD